MLYRVLATTVAIVHLGFILFVVLGGVLVLRWPRVAWLHIPAAILGALIEFAGWYCPLTDLENYFLRKAGRAGYTEGFVAHYLVAVIYPSGLTRGFEIAIGVFVVAVNAIVYVRLMR